MNRRTRDQLMERLRRDADRICLRFGLRYRSIEPERANVKRRYGICYDDGSIKIRLRHAATGQPLKYSSLVSTLCHELAHLKHFNHGPQFQAFNARLLGWARVEGIYRPGWSHAQGPSPATIGRSGSAGTWPPPGGLDRLRGTLGPGGSNGARGTRVADPDLPLERGAPPGEPSASRAPSCVGPAGGKPPSPAPAPARTPVSTPVPKPGTPEADARRGAVGRQLELFG